MQTTLEALEKALAPIEHIGREETVFEADGVKVALRVMLPEEENDVQRYATKALPGPLGDEATQNAQTVDQLDYIERFKIAVLSHALIQVGDADFRDLKYVETGEELDNGKKVRIEKHLAVRTRLHTWSGALRTRLFQKYAELLNRMERNAEEAIQFEPSDVGTEIERLEKRLERLRKSEAQKTQMVASNLSAQVAGIAEMEKPFADAKQAPPGSDATPPEEAPEAPEEAPEVQEAAAPQPRQPITPQSVPAPAPPPQAQVAPPAQTFEQPPEHSDPIPEEALPPQRAGTMVPPEMPDSFVDTSDTDGLRTAMAAEEARILEQRRRRAEAEAAAASVEPTPVIQDALDGPSDPAMIRRPPHADIAAAEAAESFVEAGSRDGVPAFRMPPESLTRSQQQKGPIEPAPINQVRRVADRSRNPRFKPPAGR